MSIMDDVLPSLAAAGKGAAAGAALGPVGVIAGSLLGVAVQAAPGVAHWLTGSADAAEKAVAAVRTVTRTMDPAEAQAALTDPGLAGDLAVQLAQIANEARGEENRASEARLQMANADTADARAQMLSLSKEGSTLAWGAPAVSVIVLVSFGLLCGLLLFRAVPDSSMTLLNILLGTLGGMATTVVSYWVGSSAGSASKDGRIAGMVPASLLPRPAAIVPAADVKGK